MESEIILDFIVEAKEHMDHIEEDLLTIESQQDNPSQEMINGVYRAIHSVKGGAGFLGLKNMASLSHVMEDILSLIRAGEMKPTKTIVDPLLKGIDQLKAFFDDWENSENVDIKPLCDKLHSLLAKEVSTEVQVELDTKMSVATGPAKKFDFEVDAFTLKQVPGSYNFYVLEFDLEEFDKKKGKTPLKLIDHLLTTGEILDSKLEEPKMDLRSGEKEEGLKCDILYASVMDKDIVAHQVELPPEKIICIQREDLVDEKEEEEVKTNEPQEPSVAEVAEEAPEEKPVPDSAAAQLTNLQQKAKSATETIRVSIPLLDQLMTLAGELVLVRNQQLQILDRTEPRIRTMVQRFDIVTSELQESIMRTRMQPVGNVFGKLPRIVRDLSSKLGKQIEINITGNEVEMDKTILESLSDPLTHIVRNSCDHGIGLPGEREKSGKSPNGTIRISAFHEGGQINIEIVDDGKGIDTNRLKEKVLEKGLKTSDELEKMSERDLLNLILLPGFSTAQKVSDVSGRGVGMDVVRTSIEQLGGLLELKSVLGKGTTIRLRLPLTLAIIPCLIVEVGEERFAIPQVNLEELVCLYDKDVKNKVERAGDCEVYRLRDNLLPLVRMSEILAVSKPFTKEDRARIAEENRVAQEKEYQDYLVKKEAESDEDEPVKFSRSLNFAVLKVGADQYGLIVDKILGTEEIVVKPIHQLVKDLGCYSGATVMGDAKVALILDVQGIANHAGIASLHDEKKQAEQLRDASSGAHDEKQTVLIFKNGEVEQFAVALPLIRRIEKIKKTQIEKIGGKEFITVDGLSTLILRLDKLLDVTPCDDREEMFLLLPKHIHRPFGILMSRLVDIESMHIDLNTESYMEEGILGTAILQERMTIFLDIYSLIEKAEPEWFEDRRNEIPAPEEDTHVLLVEDVAFFRQLLKGYLESDGYVVITAENGQVGLDRVQDSEIDLIISDIEMPVMNGFEFMRSVRSGSHHSDIPALALSALDSEEDVHKALDSGFNAYEVKIDREKLLRKTAEMLSGH